MTSWPQNSCRGTYASSQGDLYLVACDEGLCALFWPQDLEDPNLNASLSHLPQNENHPLILQTKQQLDEYFKGHRQDFNIPLYLMGTDFQKKVWQELCRIPYGQTITYVEQARKLGDAKKARAVGTANGKNLICIIVPCHRVITKSGSLGGYRGGLSNKQFLLNIEKGTFLPRN